MVGDHELRTVPQAQQHPLAQRQAKALLEEAGEAFNVPPDLGVGETGAAEDQAVQARVAPRRHFQIVGNMRIERQAGRPVAQPARMRGVSRRSDACHVWS